MRQIDLNADLGESFGAWRMGDDEGVMPWITSANIACGFHAGDPPTMRKTVALCVRHRVALGAHPSLLDLQGFGRREMKMSPDEIYAQTLYQIGALQAFAHAAGTRLRHVKPHGALYNMAACERALADAIAHAVADFDRRLILVGLAGSALVAAGLALDLAVSREGFCDRRYRADGSLTSRSEPHSVFEDRAEAVAQAVAIATRQQVVSADGATVRVEADTLCVHGDRPDAALFAHDLHQALQEAGIQVTAGPARAC
ncbi:MAG: LamB/YcsF family protein [Xanthomonadales bacterium]|nr:LamB/YcsF family protein [Xanthomonadales bacterium]